MSDHEMNTKCHVCGFTYGEHDVNQSHCPVDETGICFKDTTFQRATDESLGVRISELTKAGDNLAELVLKWAPKVKDHTKGPTSPFVSCEAVALKEWREKAGE